VAQLSRLLFGQHQIAVMTTDQITHHGNDVFIRFGQHDVPTPEPLGAMPLQLIIYGKSHVGIGSPTNTRWLFPGGMPGQPITDLDKTLDASVRTDQRWWPGAG
jgi:hypothetical protein